MKNSIDILTQEQLKEFLHYEPLTGIFTWLKLPLKAYSVKVGDIAGTKQHGYIHIQIFGKKQYAQRLAWLYMTGNWPSKHIDHKNGIRDCNIWCNLRDCTDSQNQFNAGLSSRNKSGYKGVSWRKATNKWAAYARLYGKQHHLGLFATAEQASDVRQAFAKLHHGEFFKDIQ